MSDDLLNIDVTNEEIEKAYKRRREREIADLKKILKCPEGRRFVLRLLSEAGMFRTPFTLDPAQTSFNCGRQDMGLWLVSELHQAEPFAYAQMLRENHSEQKSRNNKQEE